jgi:hypothetical protein
MGAELWYHEAPWHPDPNVALADLQAHFLAENYDLPRVIAQQLISTRDAVKDSKANKEYQFLVELYEEQVQLLEALSSKPIPQDPQEQIKILRQIQAYGGQGIGNILDVTNVSNRRDFPTAEQLPTSEISRLVGTTQPTRVQAEQAIDHLHGELQRGETVCFPIYDDTGGSKSVGWYFVGNTVD